MYNAMKFVRCDSSWLPRRLWAARNVRKLGVALLALTALCSGGNAAAQACRVHHTGITLAYYFDNSDTLLAVEALGGRPRSVAPSTTKSAIALMGANLDTEISDANSSGTQIDAIGAGAKTAAYFGFQSNGAMPKYSVCVEDLSSVSTRPIITAIKQKGDTICKCSLVWCGRYLCCPCP
jgi:hypothetical protein